MTAKKHSLGIVGRKAGMSRVFTEDGQSIPVTLIEATPNRITQIKTVESDGYSAVQVTAGVKRASLLTKPEAGHLAKAKVEAGRGLWELRVEADQIGGFEIGGEIKADIFEAGQMVDVAGVTQGKGFAGAMKRWGFGGLRATHGVSVSHRSHGSTRNGVMRRLVVGVAIAAAALALRPCAGRLGGASSRPRRRR